MALDWLPGLADLPPRRRWPPLRAIEDVAAVSVPKTIPIPDVLHTAWFLPEFPERIPRSRPPFREFVDAAVGLKDIATTAPLSWAAHVPDRIPARPGLPPRDRAETAPVPSEVIIAGLQAWKPFLPGPPPKPPLRIADPVATVPVLSPGLAAPCVHWGLEGQRASDLSTEGATTSALLNEGLATSTLLREDLC